jgi:hypothetical protein
MVRGSAFLALVVLLAACGGGGGGGPPVQPASPLRIAVDDVEIGTAAGQVELTVQLIGRPTVAATLLEVAVELPAALSLPANNRLAAAAAISNLDGDFVGGRFVVLCGDAQNANAAALVEGPLFRLRVQPTSPRQPGSYPVRFVNLRGASRDGRDDVATDSSPITATVVIR